MTVTVSDMMTKELETIEEASSVLDAAKRMRDARL
jgi:hypothetical protein